MSPVNTNYLKDLGNVFVSYADFLAYQSQAIPIVQIDSLDASNNISSTLNYFIPQSIFDLYGASIPTKTNTGIWNLVVKTGYTATFDKIEIGGSTIQVIFPAGTYTFEGGYEYKLISIDAA